MKFLLLFTIFFSSISFAQEETEFDRFVDKKKDEHLSKETQETLKPPSKAPPKEGETEFDQFVDKEKKENFSPETREKLEAKPEITPDEGETKFDKILDDTLKNEKPERKEGLIDPLIDGAKEASASGKKKIEEVIGPIKKSQDLRDNSFGTLAVGYQPFATWIPSKWTVSYTQNLSRYWAIEGEYAKSSLSLPVYGVNIGKISEQRATLQARYFPGNSFNWSFGLIYQRGKAQLGGDIPAVGRKDDFEMESFGATVGMGNRWQWENGFTLGIDWLRVNQPFFGQWENEAVLKTVNAKDSKELKKIMRAFNTLPTFVILGIQLGYTF